MKLISWNVNGIRAAIKKGFLDYFNEQNADIFCLQETKFLKEAKECGLKTINGLDMLIEQALKTDEILYGILLSTQLKKKIRKKIKKGLRGYYENSGN